MFGSDDGGFRSAQARQRYLALYDRVRALTPRPDVVHDVPTEFGAARVYQHGPNGGVPIVLIHGYFLTSAMWWPQVAGLAGDFTVYTMDMLGQPGAGMQSKAMLTPARGARCIAAVLAGLGLHDVHLVGHSYGGWLATHTAARAPDRLATLTLIDPAHTVTRLSATTWRSLALLLVRPNSARARRAAAWITGDPAAGSSIDMLTDLFVAGFAAFASPFRTPQLQFAGNRLLRSVHRPVQVLLAGNSVHDSATAIRRIQSVVPNWEYSLWPYASHALFAEAADEVNWCIRRFAAEHRSRS
ncbi:alpha/beta hydrolase [Mycobacterium koreense]|uniref:Alpha/beta hydrolase n=1 Tax=Mycolicibacillus koreensis TaxID=1069220 RepID=A0A7I7SFR4_9MYCO|nr:alpha/beta hydrolase [Mycolicibacillus koreensis]MCV7250446.1 alpha/beta hydrolase [Mycolicibacillus koreensis]OSC27779.1 alpha/beta hydrolase [Mycolicibacillus koreensis]BBY55787.1 carboxylesterase [Mycolicibacillus koreensis]